MGRLTAAACGPLPMLPPPFDLHLRAVATEAALIARDAQAAASTPSSQVHVARWAAGAGHTRTLPRLPRLCGRAHKSVLRQRRSATAQSGAQAVPSASCLKLYIPRWAAGAGHTRAQPRLLPVSGPTAATLSTWGSAPTEGKAQAAPSASSSHAYITRWAAGAACVRALPRPPPLLGRRARLRVRRSGLRCLQPAEGRPHSFTGTRVTQGCAGLGCLPAGRLAATELPCRLTFAPHPQRCTGGHGPSLPLRSWNLH